MITRALPRTGEPVPVIGLGTWQAFDARGGGEEDLRPLAETLRVLVDAGGRVVDSSPMYGRAEEIVGTLSTRLGVNATLFVATKVWTTGRAAGLEQITTSLRRLRRSRLDLLQVHNLVDWKVQLATLRRLAEEGRVRHVGVTHYRTEAFDELERILRTERVDVVQLPYSAALREAERRLLPAAADTGTAVIVNRPFEGGDLLRRLLRSPLPESIRAWAGSWPQALLKFLVAHPAVTCVIPGTGNPRHMEDDVQAGFGRLPDRAEREALVRAIA